MPDVNKLWNATHPDFKAVFDGKRYVMRCVAGVTKFVPVEEAAA